MKKKKIILAIAAVVLAAGVTTVVACTGGGKVQVTLESNGGTEYTLEEMKKGSEYDLPVPEKTGYSFEGWYTTEDFSGEPITSVVVNENVTYYAKWEQMYKVTLELDGGSISGETSFYLKSGENIYDSVKDIVPTKGGLRFGGWFKGTAELTENTNMAKQDVTFTAKYKAAYTIELYAQTLADATVYEPIETITDYEYVGKTYEADERRDGYTAVNHTNTVDSVTIKENAAENVMKVYYKRNDVNVTFDSNYPVGTSTTTKTEIKYGMKVTIPYDYTYEGYCLVGWSATRDGEVKYAANYVESVLYGGTKPEDVTFEPATDTTLFAVWKKGYTDLFGGDDYIFRLSEDSMIVYLARGDVFFEGTYWPDGTFSFENDINLEGKLNDDGLTFLYFDHMDTERNYYHFRSGEPLSRATIRFGRSNEITYTDEYNRESVGTYTIVENEHYIATFTSGNLNGQTWTIELITALDATGTYQPAFQVRNNEEYELGSLVRLAVNNGVVGTYYPMLTLDGFGVATLFDGSNTVNYYYSVEDEIIKFTDQSDNVYRYARLIDYEYGEGTATCYAWYEPSVAQEFDLGDGEELWTDGLYNATYTDGTDTVNGCFELTASAMGGQILTLTADETKYVFYISSTTVQIPDPSPDAAEDATIPQTTYSATKKSSFYKEYYYKDESYIYYSPLIVVDGEEVGGKTSAILYDYTSADGYVEALYGYYTYDATTRLYTFTVESVAADFDADVSSSAIELATLKTFVFAFDSTTTYYNVHYWYSLTDEVDGQQKFGTEYTMNEDTLTIVAGFVVYKTTEKGEIVVKTGMYTDNNGYFTLTFVDETKYVILNGDDFTFETLEYAPYVAYMRNADGSVDKTTYLSYDGKGNVQYVTATGANNITVTEVDEYLDRTVYSFVLNGTTKSFIEWTTASERVFSVYDATYAERTYSSDDATVSFDGYGYRAEYKADTGDNYSVEYTVVAENVIRLTLDGVRYVDLKVVGGNYTFTLRGLEYGEVTLVNNQEADGYFEFDGYTNFTYYKSESATGKAGTYEKSGNVFTLTFADETVWTVEYSYEDGVVMLSRKDVVKVYVNELDWSVLMLDEFGGAVKYTARGEREYGYYTLITEDLLYYINRAGSDACIYEYSVEEETATPIQPDEVSYYSANFESLQFTEYGFAIFNGQTEYFFNEEDDGTVYIYRLPVEGETADTAYGYKKIKFGKFSEKTIQWENVDYYKNEGSYIDFTREADETNVAEGTETYYYPIISGEDRYDLKALSFRPSGMSEFSVNCTIEVEGNASSLRGYITREVLDDGTVEAYVTYGYYRWDVELVFDGGQGDSSYKITSMRYMVDFYSYQYLVYYYTRYVETGSTAAPENEFGMLTYCFDFDINGEAGDPYVMGWFGKESNLFDLNGDLVSFEKAESGELNTSGVNRATFVNEGDGCTYTIYFILGSHQAFNVPAYQVYAFTREQTIENDDYQVTVERVITSEPGYFTTGNVFALSIKNKDGSDIATEEAVVSVFGVSRTKAYYVVRTVDSETGKITATTYYTVTFTETLGGSVEDADKVGLYNDEVTVDVNAGVKVVYDANNADYVDIDEATNTVYAVCVDDRMYVVSSCAYAEGKYTVVTTAGYTFEITVTDNVVTITDVTEQSQN